MDSAEWWWWWWGWWWWCDELRVSEGKGHPSCVAISDGTGPRSVKFCWGPTMATGATLLRASQLVSETSRSREILGHCVRRESMAAALQGAQGVTVVKRRRWPASAVLASGWKTCARQVPTAVEGCRGILAIPMHRSTGTRISAKTVLVVGIVSRGLLSAHISGCACRSRVMR